MSTREECPETGLRGTESVPAVSEAAAKLQASLAEARAQASLGEEELLALQFAANAPDGVAELSVFRNPALQSIHETILSLRRAASGTAAAADGVGAQRLQRSRLTLLEHAVGSVGAPLAGRGAGAGADGPADTVGAGSALHSLLADSASKAGGDEVGRIVSKPAPAHMVSSDPTSLPQPAARARGRAGE